MNLERFLKRLTRCQRFGLLFTGTSRFKLPASFRYQGSQVPISYPPEPGLAIDFLELMVDDDYGLLDMTPRPKTVIDVGGNIGLFSLWASLNFPEATIHCYEPNPRLQDHLAHNLGQRATVFREGVGSKDGTASMIDHSESRLGRVAIGSGDDLTISSIRKAVTRIGGSVDLLKLDCEGAEWDILADSDAFRCVREVRMEYHLVDQHTLEELLQRFRELGFLLRHLRENSGFGIAWFHNDLKASLSH